MLIAIVAAFATFSVAGLCFVFGLVVGFALPKVCFLAFAFPFVGILAFARFAFAFRLALVGR